MSKTKAKEREAKEEIAAEGEEESGPVPILKLEVQFA